MAAERVGEDFLAQAARFRLLHSLEAGARETRLVRFHDESAAPRRVAVVMRVEIADRRVAEGLRQRVVDLRRAEPGEMIGKISDAGAELLRECAPHQRIDAVGADHQIGIAEFIERGHRAGEYRRDADRAHALLQQLQQLEPADGGKADAVDDDALVAVDQRHVVPGFHLRRDRGESFRVVLAQEFERAVGEHHAEAEGGVGRILLEQRDVGIWPPPFDQIGQIKSGRAGPENGNAHR